MYILVLDITAPSGNYHKSLPISEQAASDPSRRGNLIREAAEEYPGGKAVGWKVVDGDRIIAQSEMKTAYTQIVPGVADPEDHARLTQGDADYVSALTGAPLQEVEVDPFEIAPKPVSLTGVRLSYPALTKPAVEQPAVFSTEMILPNEIAAPLMDAVAMRRAAVADAREAGCQAAYAAGSTVESVLHAFETPYGDGGDGKDTSMRDAYEDGFNQIVNNVDVSLVKEKPRGGYDTGQHAETAALHLSEVNKEPYWVADRGRSCNPRWGVIRGFRVGDFVSKGYNGDYYPLGRVKRLGGAGSDLLGYRIITVETPKGETTFWRRKYSDVWKEGGADGTFGLVLGLHDARNPSF